MRVIQLADAPRCIIVGAGTNDTIPSLIAARDLVIAADGGMDFLKEYSLTPHYIIGDFDSITKPPAVSQDDSEHRVISLPAEKDDTDMTSAVKLGWSKGFRNFHIYGGLGGRIDHTFANVQLLSSIAAHGGIGFLYSKDTIVCALSQARISFEPHEPAMVSVFSQSDLTADVTISNFKYEVANAQLRNTVPLGVSNEFADPHDAPHPQISAGTGILIITFPADAVVTSVEFHSDSAASLGEITTFVSSLLAH